MGEKSGSDDLFGSIDEMLQKEREIPPSFQPLNEQQTAEAMSIYQLEQKLLALVKTVDDDLDPDSGLVSTNIAGMNIYGIELADGIPELGLEHVGFGAIPKRRAQNIDTKSTTDNTLLNLTLDGVHLDEATRDQVEALLKKGEIQEYDLGGVLYFDSKGQAIKKVTIPRAINDPRPSADKGMLAPDWNMPGADKFVPFRYVQSRVTDQDLKLAKNVLTNIYTKVSAVAPPK